MSARVDGLVRADSMPLLVDLILSCDSVVERVASRRRCCNCPKSRIETPVEVDCSLEAAGRNRNESFRENGFNSPFSNSPSSR
jgi:hypothetical protein